MNHNPKRRYINRKGDVKSFTKIGAKYAKGYFLDEIPEDLSEQIDADVEDFKQEEPSVSLEEVSKQKWSKVVKYIETAPIEEVKALIQLENADGTPRPSIIKAANERL